MPSRNLAILVGVGSFDDAAFKTLRFCNNDINDLGQVLSNADIAQFDVQTLYDPKRDQIVQALDKVSSNLQPEDKFLFYYAGHGKRSPSGKLYLIAKDTHLDTLRATGVPIDQVLEFMQDSRSSQRVMILDCCHSGAVGGEFRGEIADNLKELARARGTCILTASTGIQLAEERESARSDGHGNGIFTRYLVEGLQTGLATSDAEAVTVDSLYEYAYSRVVVTSSNQTPMKWVLGGVGNIVLGKSSSGGWQKQRKAIQEEFRNLHNNRLIPGTFLDSVVRITNKDWIRLDTSERQFADLLLLFSRKEITLIELLAKEAGSEKIATKRSEPAVKGNDHMVAQDHGGKEKSYVKADVIITLGSMSGFMKSLILTPIGPVLMFIGLVTLQASSNPRYISPLMIATGAAVGLAYVVSLYYRRWKQIRRDGGLSGLSLLFVLMNLVPLVLFGITLWLTILLVEDSLRPVG
jgi:hypothetical protein